MLGLLQVSDGGGAAIAKLRKQGIGEQCRDLIASLLQPTQDRRPTASQALRHPWLRPATAAPSQMSAL